MSPLTNQRFVVWLKKKCRKFLLIRTLSIFHFLLNRKHGAIAIDDRTLSVIMGLSVFSRSSSIDHFNLCRTWENADTAHRNGNFFFANRLRRDVLEQLYIYNRIEQAYFPPLLSKEFFGPIGHHGILGFHVAAQRLGLLPRGTRLGFAPESIRANGLLKLYKPELEMVNSQGGCNWTELPDVWHIAERMQMIRAQSDFVEMYDLMDQVFKTQVVNLENPLFTCDSTYLISARKELERFGISESDWFIGLHIRNYGPSPAFRNQSLENYLPAIEEVTSRGGWVIRIGDDSMDKLPNLPRVIDLVNTPNASSSLHLYVMSQALFFIGTCSGPSTIPPLFGVPILITNQVGIGHSTLILSSNSFHLPKTYEKRDGTRAGLHEILNSPFGFGQMSYEQFASQGILIKENTSEEIRSAVIEMFLRISGGPIPRDSELQDKVNSIRDTIEWSSRGLISNAFLTNNEKWYLN